MIILQTLFMEYSWHHNLQRMYKVLRIPHIDKLKSLEFIQIHMSINQFYPHRNSRTTYNHIFQVLFFLLKMHFRI